MSYKHSLNEPCGDFNKSMSNLNPLGGGGGARLGPMINDKSRWRNGRLVLVHISVGAPCVFEVCPVVTLLIATYLCFVDLSKISIIRKVKKRTVYMQLDENM